MSHRWAFRGIDPEDLALLCARLQDRSEVLDAAGRRGASLLREHGLAAEAAALGRTVSGVADCHSPPSKSFSGCLNSYFRGTSNILINGLADASISAAYFSLTRSIGSSMLDCPDAIQTSPK